MFYWRVRISPDHDREKTLLRFDSFADPACDACLAAMGALGCLTCIHDGSDAEELTSWVVQKIASKRNLEVALLSSQMCSVPQNSTGLLQARPAASVATA